MLCIRTGTRRSSIERRRWRRPSRWRHCNSARLNIIQDGAVHVLGEASGGLEMVATADAAEDHGRVQWICSMFHAQRDAIQAATRRQVRVAVDLVWASARWEEWAVIAIVVAGQSPPLFEGLVGQIQGPYRPCRCCPWPKRFPSCHRHRRRGGGCRW